MCLNLKKALVQSFEKHRFLHNSALQGHFGEIPPRYSPLELWRVEFCIWQVFLNEVR